jgi:hypothetical protein
MARCASKHREIGLFGFEIGHLTTLQTSQKAPRKVVELARRHGDHHVSCTGLFENPFQKLLIAFGASCGYSTVRQLRR